MERRREVRFPVLLIAPFMLAGGLSHSVGRGPGVLSEEYAGPGPGISFGGFGTGNVPLAQGGTLQVPWNALQGIRGSRTRNIIRQIWDRECSTRAGWYAASAVERTAGTGVADPEFHSADRGPGMFHSRGASRNAYVPQVTLPKYAIPARLRPGGSRAGPSLW
ncbi:hypothetical protein B0H13DRAFT_1934410 [Mycena leptocephala]|nr:hypothetical protein B0H13DRAFT_1934410 [Mycena leptocephala]